MGLILILIEIEVLKMNDGVGVVLFVYMIIAYNFFASI